jgi:hypothetical protein
MPMTKSESGGGGGGGLSDEHHRTADAGWISSHVVTDQDLRQSARPGARRRQAADSSGAIRPGPEQERRRPGRGGHHQGPDNLLWTWTV